MALVIENNYRRIRHEIDKTARSCHRDPDRIRLIAVSKRKPAELIQQALDGGARDFGENYIQEAVKKIDLIGKDAACWHFIGHLQSNKARFAVQYFDYIHTVDSLKLAREINKQAAKRDKVQKILIQINIGNEASKSGAGAEQAAELVNAVSQLDQIAVKGLMCMPPFFPDPENARTYFKQLNRLKEQVESSGIGNIGLTHLSMGMSNDFKVAIEEGSTMVRVGTSIFGERD